MKSFTSMLKYRERKKMKKKNKEGIVLIYVLTFTFAITTLLLILHYKVEKYTDGFITRIEFINMENRANIGYAVCKKLLEMDKNSYDWYGELWSKEREIETDKYRIKIKITDEDGKLNINKIIGKKGKVNTALLKILKNLFTILGYSDEKVDCLLDWMDEDDLPRSSGAESSFYKSNGYPYVPLNKPLYSIKEISLIKGFTEEIIYGKAEEEDEEEQNEIEENTTENNEKGLINFLSVSSDDKININTCEGEILNAMGYNQANVETIITERERRPLNESFLLKINRNVTLNNKRVIKYKSSHFLINVMVENIENNRKLNLRYYTFRDKMNKIILLRKEKIWEN